MTAVVLLASAASARGDEPRRLRLFALAGDTDPVEAQYDREWQPVPDPPEPHDGRW